MADANTTAPGNALTAPVQSGSPPATTDQSTSQLPLVVRRNISVLRPIADAIVLAQAQNEGRSVIQSLLKDGRDYGTVPGVSKPSLLKPGAEKVNAAYGLVARFTVVEKEIDHYVSIQWSKMAWAGWGRNRKKELTSGTAFGLYRYVINCELIDRGSGEVVGSSLGSCSTLESKYIDRPRDLENTIIKMAEKRAYIGATLLTHGLSEQFTQDVEDTGVASDDTQAIEPQDQAPVLEVGSAEWAIEYPVPSPIHKKLKLADDVTTFGQLNWKQLDTIVAGSEALITAKPEKRDVYAETIRAARRMQEELEERAALADDDEPAGDVKGTDPTTNGAAGAAVSEFQPLKSDGGAVPAPRSESSAEPAPDVKKLPF